MSRRPPTLKKNVLIDPPSLGSKILEHRQKIELKLAQQLEDVSSLVGSIQKAAAARQLLERVIKE